MKALGIDIGGSSVKGGIVDLERGELVSERFKVKTGAIPAPQVRVLDAFEELIRHFKWTGKVGVGFPALVRDQVIRTATNVDKAWVGCDIGKVFGKRAGLRVYGINDADAAGLAEAVFGNGRRHPGTVLLLTLGTGIGSALLRQGILVPNTEFGHLQFKGDTAEAYCSVRTKDRLGLSTKKWAKRLDAYLHHLELLLAPDLILLGGGISRKFDSFARYLTVTTEVRPAQMHNIAGIVGAAMVTRKKWRPS